MNARMRVQLDAEVLDQAKVQLWLECLKREASILSGTRNYDRLKGVSAPAATRFEAVVHFPAPPTASCLQSGHQN